VVSTIELPSLINVFLLRVLGDYKGSVVLISIMYGVYGATWSEHCVHNTVQHLYHSFGCSGFVVN